MKVSTLYLATVLAALALSAGTAGAQATVQDQRRAQTQQQVRDREIYGYQLMTPQERDAYRARMRTAKTAEERERIRNEHHVAMQARAKERGLTIPAEPPARRGPGAGRGAGPGPGPGASGTGGGGGSGK